MQEIIKAQGGKANIDSEDLKPCSLSFKVIAKRNGIVKRINSQNITLIAKILGAPKQKGSGIYLDKKIKDKVVKEDVLYTLYSQSVYNLNEAKDSLKNFPIMIL